VGGQGSIEKNSQVFHWITGRIVAPTQLKVNENNIPVCSGTTVTVTVTDQGEDDPSGQAINVADSANITCNPVGCIATNLRTRARYTSTARDGRDRDRMKLIPQDSPIPK